MQSNLFGLLRREFIVKPEVLKFILPLLSLLPIFAASGVSYG